MWQNRVPYGYAVRGVGAGVHDSPNVSKREGPGRRDAAPYAGGSADGR